jgi:hypothetical protein
MIQDRAEARAQRIQEELEDEQEEAEFEREMEAIQARNRRKMSIFSSSSVESWDQDSQSDSSTDPLTLE